METYFMAKKSRQQINIDNARRYPAGELAKEPDDELLNASAVSVDLGVSWWTFQKEYAKELTHHVRPGLRGKRPERTYLKSDVRTYLKAPVDTNGRYELADGTVEFSIIR